MSVKDPKTNVCVMSGEIVEAIQERETGSYILGKVKIKIFNLAYDKEAKKEIYKPGMLEVKILGKADGSSGSPLSVLRSLKVGDKALFTGKMRWDYWTYNDKECSKQYLDARECGAIETKDAVTTKAKPVEHTEAEAGTTEDDLPF